MKYKYHFSAISNFKPQKTTAIEKADNRDHRTWKSLLLKTFFKLNSWVQNMWKFWRFPILEQNRCSSIMVVFQCPKNYHILYIPCYLNSSYTKFCVFIMNTFRDILHLMKGGFAICKKCCKYAMMSVIILILKTP